MLENPKPFISVLALALLAAAGCYNFDEVFEDCVAAGRCKPTACDPAAADAPDDLFFDNNCDGLDGMADAGVFVDPRSGKDTATSGTREQPYQTLTYALRQMPEGTATVYLAQGTYDEPGLKVDKPVSLHGGYSGVEGNWARAGTNVTQFGGGSTGLTVSGLGDAGVTLEWLHINSATSPDASAPSIGLRVLDSNGVRLRHVEILAGAGTDGPGGSSGGGATLPGGDGGVGVDSNGANDPAPGGLAGPSACGASGNGGGSGGKGSSYGNGFAGDAGVPVAAGGDGGVAQDITTCSTDPCVCPPSPGADGKDGSDGDAGTDGDPGTSLGLLAPGAGTWLAKSATDGQPGNPGGGGGGGGGGGYCRIHPTVGNAQAQGGGGGGGGAGGCPGQGGGGGKSGGASIALLLFNAHVELEECSLKTAGGGGGGAGGMGSPGGTGGVGAPGGAPYTENVTFTTPNLKAVGGKGGKGGKGGGGGNGGNGGNGAGGPSVGIWCGPGSSIGQTGTSIVPGPAGLPGPGPGPKDTTAIRKDVLDCP